MGGKVMKTRILLFAIAAVSLLTVFSCSENIESEVTPIDQTNPVKTYTMTVVAGKGEIATKALNLTDGTLNATWAEGEKVTVYNKTKGADLEGYLTPQTVGGASTTLSGQVTGTIEANDELTLKFLDANYENQLGTIAYIAANCDYATAEVKVKSIADGNITTTAAASFTNQQAIVEFTLKESDGTAITSGVTSLTVIAGETTINVTPSSATNVLYVAIPAISNGAISLKAVDPNGAPRSYDKTGANFENGKYYKVGVKMDCIVINDTELFAANTSKVPKIILGADITIQSHNYVDVKASPTIELNGHYIAGYSNGASTNRIFYVDNGKSLTLNGPGTLKDCNQGNGGAIYNHGGTLVIDDVTFTGCSADGLGGAIYNSGTLSLNDVTFTGNSATNKGGAIYNSGTLNMKGTIVATDNTGGNVYLETGTVINVTGAFTEGTSIGVTVPGSGEGIFTSGYATYNPSTDPATFFIPDIIAQVTLEQGEANLVALDPAIYALNVPYLNQWEGTATSATRNYCIKMSSITDNNPTLTSGWYVVDQANLTFNTRITISGTVNIILADNTYLDAKNSVYVPITATLHVWSQSTKADESDGLLMGTLSAASSTKNYAAIGGKEVGNAGYLHFHGGYVLAGSMGSNATNPENSAGIFGRPVIGAGNYGTYIYGGVVSAFGGDYAAGIGGQNFGICGGIKITGGTVFAHAGSDAAGIGSGYRGTMHERSAGYTGNPASSEATEIRITGGNVEAYGLGGAGIGGGVGEDSQLSGNGGYEGDGAIVIIDGGSVYAQAGEENYPAGINGIPDSEIGANAIGWGYKGTPTLGINEESSALRIYSTAKVSASLTTKSTEPLYPYNDGAWKNNVWTTFKRIKIEP